MQVVISGSIGHRLARCLEFKGIQPIIAPETDPDTDVTAYLAGSLVISTLEEHNHTHDHEAGHDHQGGCNQKKTPLTAK